VSVESTEELGGDSDDLGVSLSGPESTTLNRSDFTKVGSDPTEYMATASPDAAGNYTATLTSASDATGNDGASGQTDTVSLTGGSGQTSTAAGSAESLGSGGTGEAFGELAVPGSPASQLPTARLEEPRETPFSRDSGQPGGESTEQFVAGGSEFPSSSGESPTAGEVAVPTSSDGSGTGGGEPASLDGIGASETGTAEERTDRVSELWQTIVPVVFATLFAIALVLATVVTLAVIAYTANE
jgi:hypothetical protein